MPPEEGGLTTRGTGARGKGAGDRPPAHPVMQDTRALSGAGGRTPEPGRLRDAARKDPERTPTALPGANAMAASGRGEGCRKEEALEGSLEVDGSGAT